MSELVCKIVSVQCSEVECEHNVLSDLQGLTGLVNPVFARGLFLPISIATGQAGKLTKVTSHLFGSAESVCKIASLPSECIPVRYAHSVLSDPQD